MLREAARSSHERSGAKFRAKSTAFGNRYARKNLKKLAGRDPRTPGFSSECAMTCKRLKWWAGTGLNRRHQDFQYSQCGGVRASKIAGESMGSPAISRLQSQTPKLDFIGLCEARLDLGGQSHGQSAEPFGLRPRLSSHRFVAGGTISTGICVRSPRSSSSVW